VLERVLHLSQLEVAFGLLLGEREHRVCLGHGFAVVLLLQCDGLLVLLLRLPEGLPEVILFRLQGLFVAVLRTLE